MATEFVNSTGSNFLFFQKYKRNTNLISFWAFLLSLLLRILVFYVFNLSTSTLLCTTKFWFFMLSTLIFIIVADFGAFSSEQAEFYEYSNAMKANDPFPLPINADMTTKNENYEKPQENIINMICSSSTTENHDQTKGKKPDIALLNVEKIANLVNVPSDNFVSKDQEMIIPLVKDHEAHAEKKRPRAKTFQRNSEMEMTWKVDDMLVLKRTKSERHEEPTKCEENEDEYSRMSDEELNRRVEEFILKFNRQMRVQASKAG